MILFNIPLLSPKNTNNYKNILENFKITLQSILYQKNKNWFVSVGCNDVSLEKWASEFFPMNKIRISQINQEFHNMTQPIQSQLNPIISKKFGHTVSQNMFPKRNLMDGMHDKAFKRLLSYFDTDIDYDYIFFLDADDIISVNLVDVISSQTSDVVFLSHGYITDLKSGKYKKCSDIHEHCGSTIAYKRNFMESIPLNKLLLYLGGHNTQKNDIPICYIKDPLLIYRIHEHNYAGRLWTDRKKNLSASKEMDWLDDFPAAKKYVEDKRFRLTGLTVSIDFGDLLSTTLPINRKHFDRFIIVTSPSDAETQKIASQYGCELIVTSNHKHSGANFNKGRAINSGLNLCKNNEWICHMDADIILPQDFKHQIEKEIVGTADNYNCIFGINRLMCESHADWMYYLKTGDNKFHKHNEKEGVRLAGLSNNKEYAIGYCQIWLMKKDRFYPEDSPTTTFSDLHFNHKFNMAKNVPINCIHISASKWIRDADYKGRKSQRWEDDCDAKYILKMKSPLDRKQTYRGGILQICVTRACNKSCFGCTQGSNLRGPYGEMTMAQFEEACKSLKDYWGVVGIFGGNPCLHPQFSEICNIIKRYIPFEQRGLWSNNLNGHGALCRSTFNPKHSNINTHSDESAFLEAKNSWPELLGPPNLKDFHSTSVHSPPLVAIQDLIPDREERMKLISECDINKFWSGMIGVFRGELRGWFCEIAGMQSALHQQDPNYPDTGCKIVPGWWNKPIQYFTEQIRYHCHACGIPLRIKGSCDNSMMPEQVSKTHVNVCVPKKKVGITLIYRLCQIKTNKTERVVDYIKKSKKIISPKIL